MPFPPVSPFSSLTLNVFYHQSNHCHGHMFSISHILSYCTSPPGFIFITLKTDCGTERPAFCYDLFLVSVEKTGDYKSKLVTEMTDHSLQI